MGPNDRREHVVPSAHAEVPRPTQPGEDEPITRHRDESLGQSETSGWSDEKREAVEHGLEQARRGELVSGPDLVTDEMVRRAAAAIEESFRFAGFPNTRLPGTEDVDCEKVARLALEAALDD